MPVDGKRVVIWLSRHKPLKAQLDFIVNKLGSVTLRIVRARAPNAEYVYENYVREYIEKGYKVVLIPVLPLSMIARLTELSRKYGFEMWWANTELLHNDKSENCPEYNPDTDAMVPGVDIDGKPIYRHYRFRKFQRIKKIELVLEDV